MAERLPPSKSSRRVGDDRPPAIRTSAPLPFERLSPRDFERLCLWLVAREGYERAEHFGAAGSEQGRDILAWKDGRRVAFQCKRVQKFAAADATRELTKLATELSEDERPDEVVFIVTCDVSAAARAAARKSWGVADAVQFWVSTELDEKVRRYPDIVRVFFHLSKHGRPRYHDEETRILCEELEQLQETRAWSREGGGDTVFLDARLVEIKRTLRTGPELKAGDWLSDRFHLHEPLKSGGFATVWRAYDRERDGVVALKVLHAQHTRDESRVERFFRGARKMAELDHPGIVRVLHARGEDDGYYFYAMEYLAGGDLRDAVRANAMSTTDAVALIVEVGAALQHAHDHGLVHRDVKPHNIVLDGDGKPKLTDFDLVRAADTTGGTRTGALGTMLYAAPEAWNAAKSADARADQYSLAMTLLFCLLGDELTEDVLFDRVDFLDRTVGDSTLRTAISRALARKRDERFASVAELCDSIGEALLSESVEVDSSIVVELGDVSFRLRWIEPGTFLMGSPPDEPERETRETQHEVTISRGFWLGETVVTQALWEQVMGKNPSRFKGVELPVENVSWNDAQEFVKKLNSRVDGGGFRLPTEAEWEYACRAGTTTPFSFGANINSGQVNCDGRHPYAGGKQGEYRQRTVPVASLPPNAWGLYEMHGNVWEWCHDVSGAYTEGSVTDPIGSGEGSSRVLRGGSWFSIAWICRSAYRFGYSPSYRYGYVGFRVARGQGPSK